MSRVDLEEQVRYRRKMNARHRQIGSVAQAKAVQWLNGLDAEKVARMSTADATRLLDVAVRIERMATSAVDAEDLPELPDREPKGAMSLHQRLIEADLNVELSDIADLLHERLGPAVSEPFSAPRQAQTPAPPQDSTPQTDDETPPQTTLGKRWNPDAGPYGGPR